VQGRVVVHFEEAAGVGVTLLYAHTLHIALFELVYYLEAFAETFVRERICCKHVGRSHAPRSTYSARCIATWRLT